ncbi:hypothetical protein IU438_19095 [Nocardia cyriacigeorgica]|uniref:hypothetical protein n=1 Tax=Nocardia cyriacigeorgica TaxID=135487 RepID=UPI0018954C42|nr:hypothetical protein [Nocardia cyriacigeorgica]MBF6397901.1 hypothetical protein [Nocardia cyriacigeorgica]MBF6402442.1 hypothetical protein [Nocardia cyriacigeorgica]
MNARQDRVAEYVRRLTDTYQPELDAITRRSGATAEIVNTGGGCMAIETTIGRVPGTDHPLTLVATTTDMGLAETRDDIDEWLVCLYDGLEGGDALAEGRDHQSLVTAYDLALSHLRRGIVPD